MREVGTGASVGWECAGAPGEPRAAGTGVTLPGVLPQGAHPLSQGWLGPVLRYHQHCFGFPAAGLCLLHQSRGNPAGFGSFGPPWPHSSQQLLLLRVSLGIVPCDSLARDGWP